MATDASKTDGIEHTKQVMLSVDVGVRTGFAWFDPTGKILRYRSQNFGAAKRLRRAIPNVLREMGIPAWLVLEGGGTLADWWAAEGRRAGSNVLQVTAELWRNDTLYGREKRSGKDAKKHAITYAHQILAFSDRKPVSVVRHDTAEAILAGFWALREIGWLEHLPEVHRLGR